MKVLVITARADETWKLFINNINNVDDFVLFATDEPWLSQIVFEGEEVKIIIDDKIYSLNEFNSIWFRRVYFEKPENFSDKLYNWCLNELEVLLYGLECYSRDVFWLSSPTAIDRARNKNLQLKVAKEIGIATPLTMISNSPEFAVEFCRKNGCVFKPLSDPNIPLYEDKFSAAFTTRINSENEESLNGLISAPGIVQKEINKKSDIRVIVFDDRVISFRITPKNNQEKRVDFRPLVHNSIHEPFQLDLVLQDKCVKLVKSLGLNFGAIDFGESYGGDFMFFEINPNGQWGWLQEVTGVNLSQILADVLTKKR